VYFKKNSIIMIQDIFQFFRTHEKVTLVALVLVFVLLRIPSIDRSLHQDEYKWPIITSPAYLSEISIPHPPLSEFIYRTAGHIVGYDVDFRYTPLFFGVLNLMLLYVLMRMYYGKKEAVLASLLWIFSYFSVLASLTVDTDGEILPFFFLLALIAYQKLQGARDGERRRWSALLLFACVSGFMVKLSFLIAIAAIVADFLWSQKDHLKRTDILRYGGYTLGAAGILALLVVAAPFIFPFFNLGQSFEYWKHFFTTNRGWFQTAIQCAKALLYMSPLLLVPFFAPARILRPLRPFFFFFGFAFLFYIVIFDFSSGALDRYLQLLVLPVVLLSAATLVAIFGDEVEKPSETTKVFILGGFALALLIALVQFIPHFIPPLHPKSEWITRALSFRWDFVFPFHGGSGPLGFYVSFLYMALSWITCLLALVAVWRKPEYKKYLLALVAPVILVYNFVFIEEYHFGIINGSAPKLLVSAVEFMKNSDDIKKVVTYNDNGGAEIQAIGKYERRYYVAPMFQTNTRVSTFNNHYFELNVPRPPDGPYQHSFDSCEVIYKASDKKMTATIYDCRKVP
jgi:hypothetical protein